VTARSGRKLDAAHTNAWRHSSVLAKDLIVKPDKTSRKKQRLGRYQEWSIISRAGQKAPQEGFVH